MDEVGQSGRVDHHANQRVGVSDIRDVAKSRSISRHLGGSDHRREGLEVREETHGSV